MKPPDSSTASHERAPGRAVAGSLRFPLAMALLAAALVLPSLGAGILYDDYHHKLLMTGSTSPVRLLESPLDMFRFFSGDEQRMAALIDFGFFPWWTDPHLKGSFWRPISSLTHWLDYELWPDTPALMHAQSIAWYALLAGIVAAWYRRMLGPGPTALLATVLFVVDDAHAMPVAFLANRNTLLAAVPGVLCLLLHDTWRRAGRRWVAGVAPLLLTLSLLAKEEGIAVCAYLAAYALFIDQAPWRQRLVAILPYGLVVIAWRICWSALGYGVDGLGLYVDPLTTPSEFLWALAQRMPILLLGLLATPPADLAIGLEGGGLTAFAVFAGGVVFAIAAILYHSLFRRRALTPAELERAAAGACAGRETPSASARPDHHPSRRGRLARILASLDPSPGDDPLAAPPFAHSRVAAFMAVSALLALVPMAATFPADRMLLFPGLGGMGVMAIFLRWVFAESGLRARARRWRSPAVVLAVAMAMIHLVAAPITLAVRSGMPLGPERIARRLYLAEPMDPELRERDLVVVNPPASFGLLHTPLIWAAEGGPMPRHFRVLTSSCAGPVEVRRIDTNTLGVCPQPGYLWMKLDRLWPGRQTFPVGRQIKLTGMTAEILSTTADGRPAEVAFRFDVPLEDQSLRWLQWRAGEFVPFIPPPVGESRVLPASLWELLRPW